MSWGRLHRLEVEIGKAETEVVSVDCFDTLLLRQPKSERARFIEISLAQIDRLKDEGFACDLSSSDLVRLRRQMTREWHQNPEERRHTGLPMHISILSGMATYLGFDGSAVELMRDVELQYEVTALCLNEPLARILQRCSMRGVEVILISDMYLSGKDIQDLLSHHWPHGGDCRVYSSADFDVTKRDGGLFRKVLNAEGASPDSVVHGGDNFHSDVVMARRNGVRSIHLPRSIPFRVRQLGHRLKDKVLSL